MRKNEWQQDFAAFVKSRWAMPFEWGRNDCCLFAADAVEAMTGVDCAAVYRGYATALEAQRICDRAGGISARVTEALGEPVPPLRAAIGDPVLVMNEGRELLAICNGTSVLAPGKLGIAVLGMESAIAAWKI